MSIGVGSIACCSHGASETGPTVNFAKKPVPLGESTISKLRHMTSVDAGTAVEVEVEPEAIVELIQVMKGSRAGIAERREAVERVLIAESREAVER